MSSIITEMPVSAKQAYNDLLQMPFRELNLLI